MRDWGERGFTLIELIVTIAVMSVIITAIYGFFMDVRDTNRFANNLVIANQIAQQQMEVYRNTPYNNLTIGTTDISSILSSYPSLRSPRTATQVVNELQPDGLKQVTLTINYTDNGGTKQLTVSTLVAARGVNK